MPDDGPPLTSEDVEAAASVGRLPALARQLVFDGAWSSMDVVLRYARDTGLPLGELEETVRGMADAMSALPPGRRQAASDEVRALLRQAAFTIAKRLERDPLTASERKVLALAASIWVELGDLERAARTFERAGDDARAAETYGSLGDLERMEACLDRDQQRRRRRQEITDVIRRFEALVSAGDRHAAVAAAAVLPGDDFEASGALAQARDVERRLCRGRAVSLRLPGGAIVRFAGAPATLGRDGLCEVVLRDPGVSRRHAVIVAEEAGLSVADAGSRGGTRLGPAVIAGRLPLRGEGELGLGEHSRLAFRSLAPHLVEVRGMTGLDRALLALVAGGQLPLAAAVAGAEGLSLRFDGPACRLERTPGVALRVGGRLVGPGCDLLHGDVIEVAATGLRLEVP
jgi:hypothetical protein